MVNRHRPISFLGSSTATACRICSMASFRFRSTSDWRSRSSSLSASACSAADRSILVLISIRWDAMVMNSLAISMSIRFISSRYPRYCSRIAEMDTS